MNDFTKSSPLIPLIKNSSPDGYAMLYEQYSAVLYGVVNAVLKDIQQAENALEQTLAHICSNINHYDAGQGSFITWAMQVARKVSISHLQKSEQTGRLQDVGEHIPGSVELILMPDVDLMPTSQDILTLILKGYRAGQVSQQLNIPVETVKAEIRKGLRLKAVGA